LPSAFAHRPPASGGWGLSPQTPLPQPTSMTNS